MTRMKSSILGPGFAVKEVTSVQGFTLPKGAARSVHVCTTQVKYVMGQTGALTKADSQHCKSKSGAE